MKFSIIIPARYAAKRFPGKLLADLGGKPVIQHVWEQATSLIPDVWIATDDKRIDETAQKFGGKVIRTSEKHLSGTDRCAEASALLAGQGIQKDVIINIQGDEPFIQPEQLQRLMDCFNTQDTDIATLANPISNARDLSDPNIVKIVRNKNQEALYFSRSPIPFLRHFDRDAWPERFVYLRHMGLYAYRYHALQEISRLEPSMLEQAESLEQLRWLENGYRILVELTSDQGMGIDTPEDLENARKLLNR